MRSSHVRLGVVSPLNLLLDARVRVDAPVLMADGEREGGAEPGVDFSETSSSSAVDGSGWPQASPPAGGHRCVRSSRPGIRERDVPSAIRYVHGLSELTHVSLVAYVCCAVTSLSLSVHDGAVERCFTTRVDVPAPRGSCSGSMDGWMSWR